MLFYADTRLSSWCSWAIVNPWLAGLRIITRSGILPSSIGLCANSEKIIPQKRVNVHRVVELYIQYIRRAFLQMLSPL